VIRALIVAVLFVPFQVALGTRTAPAVYLSAIAFLIMIPFGWAFDRMLYRIRLRRWERRRAGH
jgi:hypothetical protein